MVGPEVGVSTQKRVNQGPGLPRVDMLPGSIGGLSVEHGWGEGHLPWENL